MGRLELPASCSQSKRATNCATPGYEFFPIVVKHVVNADFRPVTGEEKSAVKSTVPRLSGFSGNCGSNLCLTLPNTVSNQGRWNTVPVSLFYRNIPQSQGKAALPGPGLPIHRIPPGPGKGTRREGRAFRQRFSADRP